MSALTFTSMKYTWLYQYYIAAKQITTNVAAYNNTPYLTVSVGQEYSTASLGLLLWVSKAITEVWARLWSYLQALLRESLLPGLFRLLAEIIAVDPRAQFPIGCWLQSLEAACSPLPQGLLSRALYFIKLAKRTSGTSTTKMLSYISVC